MGKFHDLMERDLRIRGYSPSTCKVYLHCVRDFVRFHMQPPDELSIEDIHTYQLHLTQDRQVSYAFFNQTVCALRFFYHVSLKKDWDIRHIPYQRTGRKLPEILSPEEVSAIFRGVENIKHRAILMTVYGAGLRLQELIGLRLSDIDFHRMQIRIRQGKGRKDRHVMLAVRLEEILHRYINIVKPKEWLFPGQRPAQPMHPRSVQMIFEKAKKAAGIQKKVSIHSLRHAFATHLLKRGVNIRLIQRLLGHKNLATTARYTHVARESLQEIQSPLDHLAHVETLEIDGER